MRKINIVSSLYKLARKANDLRAVIGLFTGKPGRFVKRIVNKQIGRHIARRFFLK